MTTSHVTDGALLETKAVSKVYVRRQNGHVGDVHALKQVNLTVTKGETLGIVGESGSGKSTLARLMLALDDPSAGEVLYRGTRVNGRREKHLRDFRRNVQVVFQDPMSSLDPRMRVHDILAEPMRALEIDGDLHARTRELLASVGLPADVLRSYPHQFSGGQRQRIAIARALGPNPEVLIADEPVSALDVSVRAQILNLLVRLIEDRGLTLIFISHDMAVVRYLCDRVAVMYRGEVVEDGPCEEIYTSPQHGYTRALLAAVPRLH